MRILIGIDDTDNAESRGTGFRARELGGLIGELPDSVYSGVTRHQLLFDPAIPYTSHNSAACICVDSRKSIPFLAEFCGEYLLKNSAPGSDAGLCLVPFEAIPEAICEWGRRAKQEVLNREDARGLAARHRIFLEGYTGDHGGVIGALAAVGLHKAGNDGRFLFVRGMRTLAGQIAVAKLMEKADVDTVVDWNSKEHVGAGLLFLDDWWRPVLKGGKKVLYVEKSNNQEYEWRNLSKDQLRSVSS